MRQGRGSFLVPDDEGIDGFQEIRQLPVAQIASVQIHGFAGRIHHRQDAQGGLGIDAEFLGAQEQFVGVILADAAQMLGGLHGVDMDVNGHR